MDCMLSFMIYKYHNHCEVTKTLIQQPSASKHVNLIRVSEIRRRLFSNSVFFQNTSNIFKWLLYRLIMQWKSIVLKLNARQLNR